MSRSQVASYVSSSAVSAELAARVEHAFDTSENPGLIRPIRCSDYLWALGYSPEMIYERHEAYWRCEDTYSGPIIILDERTARDESVLMVDTEPYEDGEGKKSWALKSMRCTGGWAPAVAANLVISNMWFSEVRQVAP